MIPGRICIVMMSALGDAVHVLPVVNALKRTNPGTHISWVLQPLTASLIRGHPSVDEVILFERKRGLGAFTDIRSRLAAREYDLVITLQTYLKAGIVTAFARAPVKLGFDRNRTRDLSWLFTNRRIPAGPERHIQDQYLEFVEYLGVNSEPVEWHLGPWDHEREWQRKFFAPFSRPVASIVVATTKPEKDWEPERWAEVVDALYEDYGLQPVLVGGRSERENHAESVITARARHTPISALGTGIRQMIGILEGSALVLSPDTGPMHMTVALGRPVIALMGYTNPKRVGPYRRFQDLVVDAYGDAGEDYHPSPQTRRGRMQRISVDDVLAKVKVWQARYAAGAPGAESVRVPNS